MTPKPSHYYTNLNEPLAVEPSYLLLEVLSATISANPEIAMGEALQTSITKIYPAEKALTPDDILNLAKVFSSSTSKQEASTDGEVKLGMGTQYISWLSKLPSQDLCMILAQYDVTKAKELYCCTDYRIVNELGRVYLEED